MAVVQLHPIHLTQAHKTISTHSPVAAILHKSVCSRNAARTAGVLTTIGLRHRASAEAYLDAATLAAGKPEAASEMHRLLFNGLAGAQSLELTLENFGSFAG